MNIVDMVNDDDTRSSEPGGGNSNVAFDALVELATNSEPMQIVVADEIAEPVAAIVADEPVVAAVVPRKTPQRIRKTPILPQKKTWLITHGIGGVQITKEMIEQTFRNIELYECYTIHDRLYRYTLFRVISKAGGVFICLLVMFLLLW